MTLIEVSSGKIVGYLMALGITVWMVPVFWGVEVGPEAAPFTLMYTAVAFVRSYWWRRMFNWVGIKLHIKKQNFGLEEGTDYV